MNNMYTFNEYGFTGMDKKVPVSFVASAEYLFDKNKMILQGGPNKDTPEFKGKAVKGRIQAGMRLELRLIFFKI